MSAIQEILYRLRDETKAGTRKWKVYSSIRHAYFTPISDDKCIVVSYNTSYGREEILFISNWGTNIHEDTTPHLTDEMPSKEFKEALATIYKLAKKRVEDDNKNRQEGLFGSFLNDMDKKVRNDNPV